MEYIKKHYVIFSIVGLFILIYFSYLFLFFRGVRVELNEVGTLMTRQVASINDTNIKIKLLSIYHVTPMEAYCDCFEIKLKAWKNNESKDINYSYSNEPGATAATNEKQDLYGYKFEVTDISKVGIQYIQFKVTK